MSKELCRFQKHRFSPIDWLQSHPGSRVQRSEKGPRIGPMPESDQSCVRSEADQTPDWSEKAP